MLIIYGMQLLNINIDKYVTFGGTSFSSNFAYYYSSIIVMVLLYFHIKVFPLNINLNHPAVI